MSLMRVIAGTILMLWQLHQQETADICDPKLYLFVTKPTCVTSWLIFPFNSVFLFLRKHFNFVGYVGRRRQFHCPRWHLKEHNQQTWPPVVDGNDMRNERLVEWNRHKSPRWDLSVSSKKKLNRVEIVRTNAVTCRNESFKVKQTKWNFCWPMWINVTWPREMN